MKTDLEQIEALLGRAIDRLNLVRQMAKFHPVPKVGLQFMSYWVELANEIVAEANRILEELALGPERYPNQ